MSINNKKKIKFEDRYAFENIEQEIEDFLSKSQDKPTEAQNLLTNNIRIVSQNISNLIKVL